MRQKKIQEGKRTYKRWE